MSRQSVNQCLEKWKTTLFHVSQLKQHVGPKAVPNPRLPLVDSDGRHTVPAEIPTMSLWSNGLSTGMFV